MKHFPWKSFSFFVAPAARKLYVFFNRISTLMFICCFNENQFSLWILQEWQLWNATFGNSHILWEQKKGLNTRNRNDTKLAAVCMVIESCLHELLWISIKLFALGCETHSFQYLLKRSESMFFIGIKNIHGFVYFDFVNLLTLFCDVW